MKLGITDITRILEKHFHHIIWQGTQQFLDQKQLVHLVIARKDRLPVDQFPQNTGNGPHVGTFAILGVAEEQLGRAVPACGDIVRDRLVRLRQQTGEAEVTQLELIALVDQEVFGLDVSVDDLVGMHVLNGLDELVNDLFDVFRVQTVGGLFQNVEQGFLHEFKHEVDPVLTFESLFELYDVFVTQDSEHLDFSLGIFPNKFIVICIFEFFDCD